MLEVHIPSVGPEAEGTRQSPEKGHMVSTGSGWEGARGPTEFPRAECSGDPALRAPAPERGGPGGRGTPCRGFLGRWGLLALPTAVPALEGLTASGRVPKCVGAWEGPESSGAPRPLCASAGGGWAGGVAGSGSGCALAPGLMLTRLPAGVRQVFRVEVLCRGRRHVVQRRYSEFHALHKRVRLRPPPTTHPGPAPARPPEVSATPITSPGPGELRSWTQTSPRAAERVQSWAGPSLCSSCPWAAGLASWLLGAEGGQLGAPLALVPTATHHAGVSQDRA